jgi:hypothetical protein
MLEHYSRIRMDAKRRALESIDRVQRATVFGAGVHQNVNQLASDGKDVPAKVLN